MAELSRKVPAHSEKVKVKSLTRLEESTVSEQRLSAIKQQDKK
jgi:hypothetical protein